MHYDTDLQRYAEASGMEGKAAGRIKRWRWVGAFVVFPSLLATLYFGLIAADVYVSESRFVIKTPERQQAGPSTLSTLIQSTGLGGGEAQASEIIGYLSSRDALTDLSDRIDVRSVFASPEADVLSRFPRFYEGGSFEDLYDYYGLMVSVQPDTDTGLTILKVNAFTPEEAVRLNAGLLELSEELVNRLNQRVNRQAIEEAEARVLEAQQRVREARIALGAFRNQSEILDPQQQGMGVLEVSNGLIAQESALRARLAEVRRATPNHPSIPAMQERIAALSEQVARSTARAVGTPTGIASKMSEYENLLVEQEFSTEMLTAAYATLEQARVEAVQQQYYLERVAEPNEPDDAILPNRLKNILAVVFASLCLYLVGWMLVVGILEHAPEN